MRVRALYFLALLVVLSGAGGEGRASCPSMTQGPPCVEFWRTDAVFIGVVTKVERVPNNTGLEVGPYLRTTAYFNVEEAFRGVEGSAIVLEMDHCGYLFKEGERYLVYAKRNPNSTSLEVRAGNTRTQPLAEASEDLEYIRGIASESGARVFGRVFTQNLNIKENQFELLPLPNIKVTLALNDQRRQVVTDSQGNYQFEHLPAGSYKLSAEFSQDFSDLGTATIKVTGHGCVRDDLATVRRMAGIAGSVLDDNGKPIESVAVSVVPADAGAEQILAEARNKGLWSFTLTNKDGDYWFPELPPGRYLVVINRSEYERQRGSERAYALPRLFYPGVNDLSGATVIVVGKDQEERRYDFHLPVPD